MCSPRFLLAERGAVFRKLARTASMHALCRLQAIVANRKGTDKVMADCFSLHDDITRLEVFTCKHTPALVGCSAHFNASMRAVRAQPKAHLAKN